MRLRALFCYCELYYFYLKISFEKVILLLFCMNLSDIMLCTTNTIPNAAIMSPMLTTNQLPIVITLPKKLNDAVSEDV